MTDARSIIATIRDGGQPSPEDLRWFAAGLASGAVTDAQAGAFAMAVLLKGLSEEGRVALTRGMRDSGKVMDWDLPGPVVDKHSTGGIGDCTSLAAGPGAGGLRGLCADDLGPGAGAYRGHAGQAGGDPGLSDRADGRRRCASRWRR